MYDSPAAFLDYGQNGREFRGTVRGVPDPKAADKYIDTVREN
jgi:hypothetical protein